MASVIGWLDQSEEHQRKMREVIDLFAESDARDELGIGPVRDAFSDLLFPGLSTIQTRARYFLFLPWLYLDLEQRRIPAAQIVAKAREVQTRLIYALEAGDERSGVIGIDAKEKLKRLPDTVYWSGLAAFDIRRFRGELGDYRRGIDRFYRRLDAYASHEAEEYDGHQPHNWDLALPTAPPRLLEATNMHLTVSESEYLRERMVTAAPDSLLAHLLRTSTELDDRIVYPWDAVDHAALADVLSERLDQARWFSELIAGAALLYNVMLAELATTRGLQSGGSDLVDSYLADMDEWADGITARHDALATMDRQRFWNAVRTAGARVPSSTRVFLDTWFDLALDDPRRLVDDDASRSLIEAREFQVKRGSLSRLQNPRQLELWGGASGVARLTYRWPTGRRIVTDIVDGLLDA